MNEIQRSRRSCGPTLSELREAGVERRLEPIRAQIADIEADIAGTRHGRIGLRLMRLYARLRRG